MPDAIERYRYDPAEWRLSWPPVIFVGATVLIIWLVFRANGYL